MKEFDETLLGAGELLRSGKETLAGNVGKAVAFLTVAVAAIVTFTDVTFSGFDADFSCRLVVFWLAASVMFFSLEHEGEALGRQTSAAEEAKTALSRLCEGVHGDALPALHRFCQRYSAEEHAYRRASRLLAAGKTEEEYDAFLRGEPTARRDRRLFRRIRRQKPYPLTPADLLNSERPSAKSELANPENRKVPSLFGSLIPSLVFMSVTVSVMIRLKSGINAEVVVEGILKLSTLLTVGFRGYLQGYRYITDALTPWMRTKAKLLEAFLAGKEDVL